jgi:ABC-type transport system substrate-binding protein
MQQRKLTRRDFLNISSATAAGALLVACAPVAPDTTPATEVTAAPAAAGEADTLVFTTGSPWGTFSPFRPTYQYGVSSNYIAMLTHSRLIDLDRNNEPQPNLATSWEVSEDAITYTFTLREDAKWHDGEPVTSKDVETTVRFILTQATNINPERWISTLKGGQAFYDGASQELPGIQLPDDYTVVFELEKPVVGWHLSAITDLQI